MTLKDWLAANDVTIAQFAARIERSAEAVRRYVVGDRIPDRDTMPNIVRETDGGVTPNDFFDIATPALCTECDHRLDDPAIRACSVRDCPHVQREAA